jgi:hypothetical protein
MKILNTANQDIIRLFEERLASSLVKPTLGAQDLFRKMARRLTPLSKKFGLPSIQLYGSTSFNYAGKHFEIDITWTFPDGAIDGINSSFLIENAGRGFQFILFDHQRGTILETWFNSQHKLDIKLNSLIQISEQYCAQQNYGPFMVP